MRQGGKGRTGSCIRHAGRKLTDVIGTVIASYLLFCGRFKTSQESLDYFAQVRSSKAVRVAYFLCIRAAQLALHRTVSCRPHSAATWDTCRKCSARVRSTYTACVCSLSVSLRDPAAARAPQTGSHHHQSCTRLARVRCCCMHAHAHADRQQSRRLSNRCASPSSAFA